jgi:prevent-host-death family protein
MSRVGVRELRQRASELLRRVEGGETIEITDHGRPVALLSPLPALSELERLRAAGLVTRPVCSLDQLAEPLPAVRGAPLPSEVLRRLRDDER